MVPVRGLSLLLVLVLFSGAAAQAPPVQELVVTPENSGHLSEVESQVSARLKAVGSEATVTLRNDQVIVAIPKDEMGARDYLTDLLSSGSTPNPFTSAELRLERTLTPLERSRLESGTIPAETAWFDVHPAARAIDESRLLLEDSPVFRAGPEVQFVMEDTREVGVSLVWKFSDKGKKRLGAFAAGHIDGRLCLVFEGRVLSYIILGELHSSDYAPSEHLSRIDSQHWQDVLSAAFSHPYPSPVKVEPGAAAPAGEEGG